MKNIILLQPNIWIFLMLNASYITLLVSFMSLWNLWVFLDNFEKKKNRNLNVRVKSYHNCGGAEGISQFK